MRKLAMVLGVLALFFVPSVVSAQFSFTKRNIGVYYYGGASAVYTGHVFKYGISTANYGPVDIEFKLWGEFDTEFEYQWLLLDSDSKDDLAVNGTYIPDLENTNLIPFEEDWTGTFVIEAKIYDGDDPFELLDTVVSTFNGPDPIPMSTSVALDCVRDCLRISIPVVEQRGGS